MVETLTNIFNDIFFEGMLCLLVSTFSGKGDLLNLNSYWGIKLLEHAFKVSEIFDACLREVANIDKMK